MSDQKHSTTGEQKEASGRRSVLEPLGPMEAATSPLRWLLVVVPMLIIMSAVGLLTRSLFDPPIIGSSADQPEKKAQPASLPPPLDVAARRENSRSSHDDRLPQPPADLSWVLKDLPAPPTAPRPRDEQPVAQWAFNAADVVARLSRADPRNGAAVYKVCVTCHSAERDGAHRIGPRLWGIVGRPKASQRDFSYSQALRGQGGSWTYAELARYLYDTRAAVPGGSMAFAGIKNPDRLADVIAYMRTLADSPAPLP